MELRFQTRPLTWDPSLPQCLEAIVRMDSLILWWLKSFKQGILILLPRKIPRNERKVITILMVHCDNPEAVIG